MTERTSQTQPTGGIPERAAGGVLHIDLDALASNWRTLRDHAGGAEAAAVVKANAYGTGIEKAVPALGKAGCRTFFVAHLSEAIRARAVAPDAAIYVLNGLFAGTCPAYAEHDLRPVLGSFEEIEEWAGFCRAQGRKRQAAIHVDTGMNRLGLTVPQGLTLKDRAELKDFETALLMSHFVSAEESDNPLNRRQIEAFEAVRSSLPGIPASLPNSSGIFLRDKPHYDLVRPGYALYGGNPTPDRDNPMRPVIGLEGRIVQLRWVEADDTVGYNGRWLALEKRRIATISVGYADGYPRSGSARGRSGDELLAGMAIVAGRRCSFAGNVSMDLITVDVTDVPEAQVQRGDTVTLIGGDLTIDEVGRRAGTIGYEILTNLGARYARAYRGGEG
ncbi:alanine racemase [Microvirga arsenatis]|uniref:Alanine racemase n=1 Tax=Microvirga arsenatis TaxID=2692265 RepID=A0ABW9YVP5_9HYPH|nr:alanine racemase [Microvirga arsenatis]NBJ10185.1 alanine racemase [Microvirga arsenatis]NBJ23253.1 alanine racemase [Microvirga arsenatis]